LFYPVYTSNPAAPAQQNTRFSITNTNQNASAFVHLFFVDGTTCSIADSIVCLTPNQTMTSFAAELDPGVTGYLIAVPIDSNGCPISFNHQIGDAYVKFESGHFGNYGAEQISAAAEEAATCNANSVTALLEFDGIHYGRIPRVLAIDSILSPGDNNSTLIFIDRFGGDLQVGAARIGNLFGVLFGDQEDAHSWGFASNLCQFRGVLSDSIPRTVPRFQNVIPAGTTGWMKFWGGENVGLFGTTFTFNSQSNVAAGAFGGARNMHKLRFNERVTLTMPVFPPAC
jgi:hypothetical protein